MNNHILKFLLRDIFFLLLLFTASFVKAFEDPVIEVKNILESVINPIQKDWNFYHDNPQEVFPLISKHGYSHIDFVEMSKWVVGKRAWSSASAQERIILIEEFSNWLLTYYTLFFIEKMTFIKNNIIEYKPLRYDYNLKKRVLISAKMIFHEEAKPLNLDFRLIRHNEGWKLYDFAVEGISILKGARETFSSLVKKSGIKGLIIKLKELNKSIEKNKIKWGLNNDNS